MRLCSSMYSIKCKHVHEQLFLSDSDGKYCVLKACPSFSRRNSAVEDCRIQGACQMSVHRQDTSVFNVGSRGVVLLEGNGEN